MFQHSNGSHQQNIPDLTDIKEFLDEKADLYNRQTFIGNDPIRIPHLFSESENIEIAGFLTATIAWGRRDTIIRNARDLMRLMDDHPYDFIMHARKEDLKLFDKFHHRTFNSEDCTYFIRSLQNIYRNYGGLKTILEGSYLKSGNIKQVIIDLRKIFFELPHLSRTEKHIPDVIRGASAKRLNMFLRWMVRKDDRRVDFGLWKAIDKSDLLIPLDVHTGSVARKLGLLTRKQNDWRAVEELTMVLKRFDPDDPVKYDFALFGLGIYEDFR